MSRVPWFSALLRKLGWWAGCAYGYPDKRWKRWRVVCWLTRFDPWEAADL